MNAAHVVCFGNTLHGDDGFGMHVYERLLDEAPASAPTIFDAGTAGLAALGYFEGCARAVIVDAIRTRGSPGRVHRLAARDLLPPGDELSLHELGLATLIAALESVADDPPEIVVIAAEVGEITPFTERLSPPLEAAVEEAVRLTLAELHPLGR